MRRRLSEEGNVSAGSPPRQSTEIIQSRSGMVTSRTQVVQLGRRGPGGQNRGIRRLADVHDEQERLEVEERRLDAPCG